MGINTIDYSIGGILPYHFWSVIGITISLSVCLFLYYYKRISVVFALKTVCFSAPCLLVGAALLGALYSFIGDFFLTGSFSLAALFHGGIVYYGGLTGFVLMYSFLWRKKGISVRKAAMDIVAIMISLFHAFGRIGCYTAGCCYGLATDSSWGVSYTNLIEGVAVKQNRIPIQLIEAAFEFVLFAFSILLFFLRKLEGKIVFLYFIIYPVFRFFAEFLRGDWNRAAFRFLSPSQIYSIFLLTISIALIVRSKHKEGRFI